MSRRGSHNSRSRYGHGRGQRDRSPTATRSSTQSRLQPLGLEQEKQALVCDLVVKAAVILELVLASELVGTESAGEGLGRVLGVDVALEGRVLSEGRAALALVGLMDCLSCVVIEGESGLERRATSGTAFSACSLAQQG